MAAFLHDFILSNMQRCEREFDTFSSGDQLQILEKHPYLMEQAFTNRRLLKLDPIHLSHVIRNHLKDSSFISKLFHYKNEFTILEVFLKLDEEIRGDLIGLYPELLQYHKVWSSPFTPKFNELPDKVFSKAMTHRLSDTQLCLQCIRKPALLKKLDRQTQGSLLNKHRKLEREIMAALEQGTASSDQAQAYSGFVEHHTLNQERFCTYLYNTPSIFRQLDAKAQSGILGQHASLMEKALEEDRLMELNSAALSAAVGYYAVNVKPGFKLDYYSSKPLDRNTATDTQRENILISIAKNPLLLNKLRSGTQIFLFRHLQLSGILDRRDVKNLELEASIIDKIRNAYKIELNVGYAQDQTGEKYKWSSYGQDLCYLGIAGVGEFSDKFNDQLHSLTYRLPIVEDYGDRVSQDWLKASAEIIVTGRNFDPLFEKFGKGLYSVTSIDKFRFKLGMEYKHVAELLISNREHRGAEGEITADDIAELAQHHNLSVKALEENQRTFENELAALGVARQKRREEQAEHIRAAAALQRDADEHARAKREAELKQQQEAEQAQAAGQEQAARLQQQAQQAEPPQQEAELKLQNEAAEAAVQEQQRLDAERERLLQAENALREQQRLDAARIQREAYEDQLKKQQEDAAAAADRARASLDLIQRATELKIGQETTAAATTVTATAATVSTTVQEQQQSRDAGELRSVQGSGSQMPVSSRTSASSASSASREPRRNFFPSNAPTIPRPEPSPGQRRSWCIMQ